MYLKKQPLNVIQIQLVLAKLSRLPNTLTTICVAPPQKIHFSISIRKYISESFSCSCQVFFLLFFFPGQIQHHRGV